MCQRSVLFVAYNFPPHGGPGVQRSAKFVKYLPEFGWRPLVVTATVDANPLQDLSLLDDIPESTPIFRVPGFSIERLRVRAIPYKLDKLVVMLNLLLQIPDAARFWARNTHTTIERIIESHRPHVIFTTSGPYSSHLVGMWVKQRFGIPWLADFRDPWSKNLLIPYLPGYRTLNQRMERRVLAVADRVTCVSEPWLDDLRQDLASQPEKFTVLSNGYDEEDFSMCAKSQTSRFALTHIGSFYRTRRPDMLVRAVRSLIDSGRISSNELRVRFIGSGIRRFVPDIPPFEAYDYVPHRELDRFRAQTDVFILILGTSPENIGNYSGKLFEYLASDRPILGIVPPRGVAQSLIEETGTGVAVHGDVDTIADAIEHLYSQHKFGNPDWKPRWNIIRQYSRRNLSSRLGSEFDRLVDVRKVL